MLKRWNFHDGNKKAYGLTAIEMLVVLALLSVLAAMAVPSFKKTQISSLQESVNASFRTTIVLAQTEAIKRSSEVVVCPLSVGNTQCLSTADWSNGWLVFVDEDSDGKYSSGGTDELLRVHALEGNPFYIQYPAVKYVFNAQGYFQATDSVFIICADDSQLTPLAYAILKYGELLPLSDTDNNGKPNDLKGADLTCI